MESPSKDELPRVDTGPQLRPSLMVFERKTAKFGLFPLYGGLKPKSSSAIRLRKRREPRAASLSPVTTAREQKAEMQREDTAGTQTARYMRLTPPSLALQGQRPPNVQREVRVACLSEMRIRRTRASELPADISSSDDDLTDLTLYEALYPRLRQEEGKDREISTMRISVVRKSRTQAGVQCFAGLHSHSFVFFAARGRAASTDLPRGVVLTVQLAKSSAWITRVCTGNGATVTAFDSSKECTLVLAPKGKPQHMVGLTGRKYNHIPGCSVLYSAERLYAALRSIGADLPFVLPAFNTMADVHAFLRYRTAHPRTIWLAKALDSRNPPQFWTCSRMPAKEPRLLVKYLRSPHLYMERKYHLGFFLLVTSLSPLVAYIASEGCIYISKEKFVLSADNPSIHFLGDRDRRPWSDLRTWLSDSFGGMSSLLATASDTAIQLLLSLESRLTSQDHRYSPQTLHNCFEVLELDVMFDQWLRPWVLGCKPLLWTATASLSRDLLEPLLCQALNIVGVEVGDRERGSLGSAEQRVLRQLEEEAARMRRSNSTLWERVFPTHRAFTRCSAAVKDSAGLNAYLCERESGGQ